MPLLSLSLSLLTKNLEQEFRSYAWYVLQSLVNDSLQCINHISVPAENNVER